MPLSSIRDLLAGSVKKAGIRRQIDAALLIESANRMIPAYLPAFRHTDVSAISYQKATIRLRATNASARYLMQNHATDLLLKLRQEFPSIPLEKIQIFIDRESIHQIQI